MLATSGTAGPSERGKQNPRPQPRKVTTMIPTGSPYPPPYVPFPAPKRPRRKRWPYLVGAVLAVLLLASLGSALAQQLGQCVQAG